MASPRNLGETFVLPAVTTSATPWVALQGLRRASLQVQVTTVGTPVGIVTIEYSSDVRQIGTEMSSNSVVFPPNTTAARIDVSAAVTVQGTNLATGYDGAANRASFVNLTTVGLPQFVRVIWTRTSGGTGNNVVVNIVGA